MRFALAWRGFALAFLLMAAGACSKESVTSVSTPAPDAASEAPVILRAVAAAESGLTYRWTIPGERPLDILQTIGNGAAFLDVNNDNNLDVLLVGKPPGMFLGDGKGRFADASATMLPKDISDHFLGCAVGDYDNDGFKDIYLSAYNGGRLLRNVQGKMFEDVTERAGLPKQPWGTACTFFDANGDGLLDLYVGNYVVFGPDSTRLCSDGTKSTSCGPRHYDPYKGRLYLQSPKGHFTPEALPETAGKVLGVAVAPPHADRSIQIAVANDEMPGDLLVGVKKGWENQGAVSGTAFDSTGSLHGGMGADWGDVNEDGILDLVVMTFQNEDKCLYVGEPGGLYTERSQQMGLKATFPFVSFGCKFFDFDNDGRLDLLIANGHVQSNAAEIASGVTYRQPLQLFQNQDGHTFVERTSAMDSKARKPLVGRGLSVGDYDNDGRVDALVVDSEGEPLLLHNEVANVGNWLSLELVGKTSNRDGYGATVIVEAQGRKLLRHCHSDGSYLSASDKRIHVGLGSAAAARVTIKWPDGKNQVFESLRPISFMC
jgi:hypothetical protein